MRFDVQVEAGRCEEVAELLAALAHPVRLRIVCGLLSGGCTVTPIAECLGLPQPLVSRHLAILREAGVVSATRRGREQVYGVVHPGIGPLLEGLAMRAGAEPPAEGGGA